jgi:diguanylate cyclase (GGDEF)-like protein/PAS domain S-box-containing protein
MTNVAQKTVENIQVPVGAIILGGDLPGMDMSELREKQVRSIANNTPLQIGAILLATFGICLQSIGRVPIWLTAAFALIVITGTGLRFAMRESRRQGWVLGTPGFVKREIALGVMSGISLILPMILYTWQGDAKAAAELWIILAGLMIVYAHATIAIPILFFAYMPLVGIASAICLALLGNTVGAVGILCLTAVAATGMYMQGRITIHFYLTGRKADERGETVSLLLREFEDAGADWLWQVDTNRRITRPSPRFAHAVGKTAEELDGTPFLQLLAGPNWETGRFPAGLHELANRLNRKESFANLIVPVSLDGTTHWWELSASPTFDAAKGFVGFKGVGSDVTEQRTSADRIAHLARFDALTGLPNRLYITETLSGALEQAGSWRRRCAFLMIDLDRFKAVNDTLGHPVGDRLLAQVAVRLKQLCSENVIAGRLGGDEFGVVLRQIETIEIVEQIGKRIVEIISRPYEIDHHTLYVGASIGYAIGPRDGESVETLTRNADLALYRSKDIGGGIVNSYEPALHDQARERRDIEIELRSALSKNEFEVHYQPVVHRDGTVDGFEALLRWNNKKLGSVSPVKFIPVAEDTRLIGPIGEWVLHTACREATNWPETTKVAVNVSAEQLSSPGFVGSVVKALAHSGLPSNRLELEVTESVFLREVSGAMVTLDQVRALGVRLSLDDFGTGYSSLGYLRMGQFSTIKVDRSFVKGALTENRESIAIIRAVVALADSLDMSTTAEGVETLEEAEAIVALGCKKLQGYYFGRPMPAADARNIFHRTKPARRIDSAA